MLENCHCLENRIKCFNNKRFPLMVSENNLIRTVVLVCFIKCWLKFLLRLLYIYMCRDPKNTIFQLHSKCYKGNKLVLELMPPLIIK